MIGLDPATWRQVGDGRGMVVAQTWLHTSAGKFSTTSPSLFQLVTLEEEEEKRGGDSLELTKF